MINECVCVLGLGQMQHDSMRLVQVPVLYHNCIWNSMMNESIHMLYKKNTSYSCDHYNSTEAISSLPSLRLQEYSNDMIQ